MSVEPVEFVIDRSPSPVGIVDLTHEDEHVFVIPNSNVNMSRRCSFCECPGHDIRNCNHTDIQNLHRSAQFMFLTSIRYLRTYPSIENPHKKWLQNLSTSELKILSRFNHLDSNPRPRDIYLEKIDWFYTCYAENELRNDRSRTPRSIYSIYIPTLRNVASIDFIRDYGELALREVIDNSGRHLLDINKIKQMFIDNCVSHTLRRPDFIAELARIRQHDARRDAVREESAIISLNLMRHFMEHRLPLHPLQEQVTKIPPKMTHNDSLTKETYEECPICYTEMTSDSMVQLGCSHSFCGDCIIGQIKSSKKATCDCAMCRSTISECSSASANLLQKITSSI
jgi:Ring finger domain